MPVLTPTEHILKNKQKFKVRGEKNQVRSNILFFRKLIQSQQGKVLKGKQGIKIQFCIVRRLTPLTWVGFILENLEYIGTEVFKRNKGERNYFRLLRCRISRSQGPSACSVSLQVWTFVILVSRPSFRSPVVCLEIRSDSFVFGLAKLGVVSRNTLAQSNYWLN